MSQEPLKACIHHWVIAEADGSAYLPSRCKKCGAERMERVAYQGDVIGGGNFKTINRESFKRAAEFEHGTHHGYEKRKCRCEACRQWNADYKRARYQRAS